MEVLIVDIETAPNLVYVWDLFKTTVRPEQIVEPTEMICWAAKWLDKEPILFRSTHHDGHEKMIDDIWKLIDDTDVVVHYNGRRFDMPHLNREFLLREMPPPSPVRQVDLYQTCKSRFKFASNALKHVAPYIGLDEKVGHEGFELWKRCLAEEESAWKVMRRYNKQDVVLTEQLYTRLLPWISNHPSRAAYAGEDCCPACGSKELIARGFAYTQQSAYHRFRCKACGRWSRSTKVESRVSVREVVG